MNNGEENPQRKYVNVFLAVDNHTTISSCSPLKSKVWQKKVFNKDK